MKKKLYIITIIFLCIFCSGCGVDYNIKIDEYLNAEETITFKFEGITYDVNNGDIPKEDVDDTIKGIKDTATQNKYQIVDNSDPSNIDLLFRRTVKFSELQKPPVLNTPYPNFSTSCNENLCSINAPVVENRITGDGNVVEYNIYIQVPFEVVKNNAHEVDKDTNTFTWHYSVVGKQDNIELIFKKDGTNIIELNEQRKRNSSWFWIIIVSIIVILIGIVVHKILKNNKPRW